MSVAEDSSLLECDTVLSAWTAWSWMKALWFFKMSGTSHPAGWSHIRKDFNLQDKTFLFWCHYFNVKSVHVPSANASSASPYTVNMQLQLSLFQVVTSTITNLNVRNVKWLRKDRKTFGFVHNVNQKVIWNGGNQHCTDSHNSLKLTKTNETMEVSHLSLVYVSTAM